MSTPRTRRALGLLTVAGLLAMLAFTYSPVLSGQLLAGRDVFRVFFPDSAFLLESLRAGELPLWTPYLRLGQPFAGTLYSQVFYPPRWAAVLVAGPLVSMTVLQVLHAALAAAGVFLLARRLRASWPASLVAGAMAGLSPMMTDLGIQQNVVDAAAWTGFILLAAHDVTHRRGWGPVARLAVYSSLSLFAGSPETTLWQGMVAVLVAGLGGSVRLQREDTAEAPASRPSAPSGSAPGGGVLASQVSQAAAAVDSASGGRPLAPEAQKAAGPMDSAPGGIALAPAAPRAVPPLLVLPRREDVLARAAAAARVVGGLALSAVLAAVALLPAAEFARNSLRSQQGWSEQLAWSVSWPQVLSAVWPLADWPRDRYWGQDQWFLLNLFLGTLPCALAVLGALHGPRRARPFAIGALLLVLLSLGRHFPPA
ncbi:MAG TPA: hypothetical protein VE153_31675, partial [Myxococcus sp.]|nr:hypothetical protein [Myxococcus sp.]